MVHCDGILSNKVSLLTLNCSNDNIDLSKNGNLSGGKPHGHIGTQGRKNHIHLVRNRYGSSISGSLAKCAKRYIPPVNRFCDVTASARKIWRTNLAQR